MPTTDIENWFAKSPASQRNVLAALRALVKSSGPGVTEELKWGRPCYATDRGLFCYLHSTKNHATLGFHKGSSLDDPDSLLEGTGKDMRHVSFKGSELRNEQALLRLVRQARALSVGG